MKTITELIETPTQNNVETIETSVIFSSLTNAFHITLLRPISMCKFMLGNLYDKPAVKILPL